MIGDVGVGTADAVGVRAGSKVVGNSAVVGNRDAARAPAVDDAKRRAVLVNHDSGELPIVEQQLGAGRIQDGTARIVFGEFVRGFVVKDMKPLVQDAAGGKRVDEIEGQVVALIKIRTGAVGGQIVGVHEIGVRPVR